MSLTSDNFVFIISTWFLTRAASAGVSLPLEHLAQKRNEKNNEAKTRKGWHGWVASCVMGDPAIIFKILTKDCMESEPGPDCRRAYIFNKAVCISRSRKRWHVPQIEVPCFKATTFPRKWRSTDRKTFRVDLLKASKGTRQWAFKCDKAKAREIVELKWHWKNMPISSALKRMAALGDLVMTFAARDPKRRLDQTRNYRLECTVITGCVG